MDDANVRALELWLYGGIVDEEQRKALNRRYAEGECNGPAIGTVSFDPITRTVKFEPKPDTVIGEERR